MHGLASSSTVALAPRAVISTIRPNTLKHGSGGLCTRTITIRAGAAPLRAFSACSSCCHARRRCQPASRHARRTRPRRYRWRRAGRAPSEALEPVVVPYFPLRDEIVEQHDLLARLRGGFSWADADRSRVAREVKWYAGHQEYLDRVFQRADPYLFHIVEELERRGMPAELALLPIVESAFDPFAYSHGRAAGLWQIIPGTGKRLGLAQNWWFDGRRDVLESTRAALDYLAADARAVRRRLAARGRGLQLRRRQRRARAAARGGGR